MQQGRKIAETEQITVANDERYFQFCPQTLCVVVCILWPQQDGQSRGHQSSVQPFDFGCVSNQCVPVFVFSASLRVSSVSVVRSDHSSICVSWRPVSAVNGYRIVIQSVKGNRL